MRAIWNMELKGGTKEAGGKVEFEGKYSVYGNEEMNLNDLYKYGGVSFA